MSLRAQMTALLERASEAGYPQPDALLHMTPGQARRSLRAFEAGQEKLAWRIGGYVALAVHDPAGYPKEPLLRSEPAQSEAAMKAALRSLG